MDIKIKIINKKHKTKICLKLQKNSSISLGCSYKFNKNKKINKS